MKTAFRMTCKAPGCTKQISPRYLMCPQHWAMVPIRIQRAINSSFALGNTADYVKARNEAIHFLTAKNERQEVA